MANYSNVDIKKLGDLAARNAAAHNLRQIPSDNVNSKKTHLNKFYAGNSGMNFDQELQRKLSRFKIRKNAVKTVNLVFSASPELFKDKEKAKLWELQTWEFIKKELGEENLIYAVVHKDEKTPHFQVSFIPVDPRGKLNASHFFDGRKKCNEFATRYNNSVKNLGLKRDKGKDKAKPESTAEYYKRVKESENLDHQVDLVVSKIDEKLSRSSKFGFVKAGTASQLLKPLISALKRYRTQFIEQKRKIEEAKRIQQENDDLKLKFENMGLSHELKFSECLEIKNLIAEGRTAIAENEAKASLHEKKEVQKNSELQLDIGKIKPR